MAVDNPAQPLTLRDRLIKVAEEHGVGGHFEGESKRERKVGYEQEVVVDILKRGRNPYALDDREGTYFMRVSLRNPIRPEMITRYEIDIERYTTEREFMAEAFKGGGLVAQTQIEKWGATWDPDYVAKQAAEAARELMAEINS